MKVIQRLNTILIVGMLLLPLITLSSVPEVPLPDEPPDSFQYRAAATHNLEGHLSNFYITLIGWWGIGAIWAVLAGITLGNEKGRKACMLTGVLAVLFIAIISTVMIVAPDNEYLLRAITVTAFILIAMLLYTVVLPHVFYEIYKDTTRAVVFVLLFPISAISAQIFLVFRKES